eukprot:6456603-Amphidinium_carterae.1
MGWSPDRHRPLGFFGDRMNVYEECFRSWVKVKEGLQMRCGTCLCARTTTSIVPSCILNITCARSGFQNSGIHKSIMYETQFTECETISWPGKSLSCEKGQDNTKYGLRFKDGANTGSVQYNQAFQWKNAARFIETMNWGAVPQQ